MFEEKKFEHNNGKCIGRRLPTGEDNRASQNHEDDEDVTCEEKVAAQEKEVAPQKVIPIREWQKLGEFSLTDYDSDFIEDGIGIEAQRLARDEIQPDLGAGVHPTSSDDQGKSSQRS